MDQKNIIKTYREKRIEGKVIDLIPLNVHDLAQIVRIRNQPKCMYFLNQKEELTLEKQRDWFEQYLLRDDDIYWEILKKDGEIIGAQRLYRITKACCEHGSNALDEKASMGGAYTAEALLLSLQVAIDVLGVGTVINEIRSDNRNMKSISEKVGFKFVRELLKDGVKHDHYELTPENFNRKKLQDTIERWVSREAGDTFGVGVKCEKQQAGEVY